MTTILLLQAGFCRPVLLHRHLHTQNPLRGFRSLLKPTKDTMLLSISDAESMNLRKCIPSSERLYTYRSVRAILIRSSYNFKAQFSQRGLRD